MGRSCVSRSTPGWPTASAVSSIASPCSPSPRRASSRPAPNGGRVASTPNFRQSGHHPIASWWGRREDSGRMKVLISGGSGFSGHHLVGSLVKDGHEVVVLTRRPDTKDPPSGVRYVTWDARSASGDWVKELSGAQAIVNLAGASIGSWPWTKKRMDELVSSRVSPTTALVQALDRMPAALRPPVLVSPSGFAYYRHRGDEIITEEREPGDSV